MRTTHLKSYIALLAMLYLPALASAQLTGQEMKIVKAIDRRTDAAMALLKKAVNINSGTMNFSGVKAVGALFMEELKPLGFEVRWESGDAFHRAGHLVAEHKGKKKGRRILLIGHLDTVFEPDSKFQSWHMVNDSMMQGPGALDMKGGDVIIILAMQALQDAGILRDLNIAIVMTGDEEMSGDPLVLSKKAITDAAAQSDMVMGFEDGDGIANHALVSRRGSSDWMLTVKGTAAHSSQIFTEPVGNGAIYEAARILNALRDSVSMLKDLTMSPGLIAGGDTVWMDDQGNGLAATGKNNIVAKEVTVTGDLRAVSKAQLQHARKIMKSIVDQPMPNSSASIHFGDDGYPPMGLTEGNRQLLEAYSKASMDLGFGAVTAVPPRNAGAADISFAADAVPMALDGLGIEGSGGHTVEETANLKYLSKDAKRAAIVIARMGR